MPTRSLINEDCNLPHALLEGTRGVPPVKIKSKAQHSHKNTQYTTNKNSQTQRNPKMSQKYSITTNIATLGIIGRTRFAPGTAGSFVATWLAPLVFLPFSLPIRLLILTFIFFLGVWASEIAAKELGREDPSAVIIDEVLGQWITFLPLANISYFGTDLLQSYEFMLLLCGFMLFRLFDITKVGPVGLMERKFSGGLGIMLDDVVAGILAASFMYPAQFYIHLFLF